MKFGSIVVALLFLFVAGTAAETCVGETITFTCIFGCCTDESLDLIYCCVSNGVAIGIIVGIIVVVLGCIGTVCKVCLGLDDSKKSASKRRPAISTVT